MQDSSRIEIECLDYLSAFATLVSRPFFFILPSPSLGMKFISKQGRRLAARLDLRFLIREAETFASNQKRLPMRTFLRLAWRSEIIFLTREKRSRVYFALSFYLHRSIILPRLFDRNCIYNMQYESIKYISLNIHIYIFKQSSVPLPARNSLMYSILKSLCN